MVKYLIIPKCEPIPIIQLYSVLLLVLATTSYSMWSDQRPVTLLCAFHLLPINNTETIFDTPTINRYLFQQNLASLSNTKGTPFTSEPLASLLGEDGEKEATEQILQ